MKCRSQSREDLTHTSITLVFWEKLYFREKEVKLEMTESSLSEPKIVRGGDQYVYVEFSKHSGMEAQFRVQTLANEISEKMPTGGKEVTQGRTAVMIRYNPDQTDYETFRDEIVRIDEQSPDFREIDSRIIQLPAIFDDPWSLECGEEHLEGKRTWERDIRYFARINDFDSVESTIKYLVDSQWWVECVGFTVGVPIIYNLSFDNPDEIPSGPKYNQPRRWTPEGTIGIAGQGLSIYARRSPGGSPMIGRVPFPMYASSQAEREIPPFSETDNPVLLRPTDRVKFVPITLNQFYEIREEIHAQEFEITMTTQSFDPEKYLESRESYVESLEADLSEDFATDTFTDDFTGYVQEEMKTIHKSDPIKEFREAGRAGTEADQ